MIPQPSENPDSEVLLLITQRQAMFLQAAGFWFATDLTSRDPSKATLKQRAKQFFFCFCPSSLPSPHFLGTAIDRLRLVTDFQRYGLDTSAGYFLDAANDEIF